MTPILVLLLLFTFIVELLFYQYALSIRWKKGLKTFSRNKNFIMNLSLSNYQLGANHIYDNN